MTRNVNRKAQILIINDIFLKKRTSRLSLWGKFFRKSDRNKYLFANFPTRKAKDI